MRGKQIYIKGINGVTGDMTRDAATGKAYLLGHTFANGYTLDYMSIFWIGMALMSVICALTVWNARKGSTGE